MFISNILPYVRYGYIYIYTLYIYLCQSDHSSLCSGAPVPYQSLDCFLSVTVDKISFCFFFLKKGFMEQNCQLYFFALSSDSFSFLHVQCMVRNKHTCLDLFTTLPKPERTPYVNNLGIYRPREYVYIVFKKVSKQKKSRVTISHT